MEEPALPAGLFARRGDGTLYFRDAPARWHDVVAYGDQDALAAYNAYRAFTVRRIMRAAQEECPACVARSVGSTNLTSDMDVTVSGPDTARFVARFNAQFRAEFGGAESGDVFDTQVYGASFVDPGRAGAAYAQILVHGEPFRELKPFVALAVEDEYSQHVWAFCKLLLYANGAERDGLARALNSSYWGGVLQDAYDMLADDLPSTPETLAKSNRKYERALEILNRARVDMDAQPDDEALRMRYKNAVSRANYHASESYFSQGPFVDVVINTQSGAQVPVTRAEYLDSYIENAGDMLKVIGHARDEDCVHDVVELSKYWSRALKASAHVRADAAVEVLNDAEFLRTRVRGKSTADPRVVRATVTRLIGSTAHVCSHRSLRDYVLNDVIHTIRSF